MLPATAMAKVSMRLVPDQDPNKIAGLFEAYLKKVAPKTVDVKLTRMHGGKPWMTEFDNKFVRAAGRAIELGFGKSPVFNREGGSIPVVSTFQQELGLPSVLFGVGLPDENAHAPDERLDLGNFHNGIIASAYLYDEISKLSTGQRLAVGSILPPAWSGSCRSCSRRPSTRRCTRWWPGSSAIPPPTTAVRFAVADSAHQARADRHAGAAAADCADAGLGDRLGERAL